MDALLLFMLIKNVFAAHGREASLMQRRCLRFFTAIWRCHCCNPAFGVTEPQKAPNA
jgi:hypothetical protein